MEATIQISIAIGSAIFVLGITRPETYLKIKETLFYTTVVISLLLSIWNGLLLFFKSIIIRDLLTNEISMAIDVYNVSWIFVSLFPIIAIAYGHAISLLLKYILKTKESKEE